MTTHTIQTPSKGILITLEGHEGGFYVYPQGNGNTGTFDPNEVPDWASNERIASCNLEEFYKWTTERIGQEGTDKIVVPEGAIAFNLLQWDALDEHDNVVVIAPDLTARSEQLAKWLGMDTSVEAFDAMKADALIITKSYADTDEQSLKDLEQAKEQGFNQGTQEATG